MKKYLFLGTFLLELTLVTAQQSKYIPFPSNMIVNSSEINADSDGFWYTYSRFEIQGDTLINGLHYSKYYLAKDVAKPSIPIDLKKENRLCGALRNDIQSKKVYLYSFGTNTEELLYDFDLHVGDTLFKNDRFKFYRSLLQDPTYARVDTVIVSRIDSILMPHDNLYHKRFNFTAKFHEWNNNQPDIPITSDSMSSPGGIMIKINPLIEGVGFLHNPITFLRKFEFSYDAKLICSSIDNKTVFNSSSLNDKDCDSFITSINDKNSASAIKLYPNPSNGKFNLEITETTITSFEISNLFGVKILSSKIDSNKMEVNLSSESSGIYFIRCFFKDGTSSTKKIRIQ